MNAIRQTSTILDKIVEQKRQRLLLSREVNSVESLREQFQHAVQTGTMPPAPEFLAGLHPLKGLGVIAEIKKASPSRGLIAPDFNPGLQSLAYRDAGVQAISVLTEEDFFLGSSHDLQSVRATVDLPLLRKDFIIEPGQIYEARLLGASAVLLICALLDGRELENHLRLAGELGLAALVEIHERDELVSALSSGARLIGINNRDLRSFQVDLNVTERLAGMIPSGRTIVSESGLMTPRDVARVYRAGAHAVLIGEALMRTAGTAQIVSDRLRELFSELPS